MLSSSATGGISLLCLVARIGLIFLALIGVVQGLQTWHVRKDVDVDDVYTVSLNMHQQVAARAASIAPTPNSVPTAAGLVMADDTAIVGPSGVPSLPECSSTSATTSPKQDQWIKIAGILVPAIVAVGLGIGGFCVTLHVNKPTRRNEEDSCCGH